MVRVVPFRSPRLAIAAAACAALIWSTHDSRLDAQAPVASGGVYQLVARHSQKCLDVGGASLGDGASVVQWSCHGGDNQLWTIEPVGGGYYRLTVKHSGKALDVLNASLDDGAPIVQYSPGVGDDQQWRFDSIADGYVRLTARHSGKSLDISGASLADGAAAIQYTSHNASNQQWQLRPVSLPGGLPSTEDAIRFLEQSTWGPTSALVDHVRTVGFEQFLQDQFAAPMSSYPTLPLYPTTRDTTACPNGSTCQRDNYTMYPVQNRFFVNALYGEDQLRQRVAFALHQIIVVSGADITQPSWMTPYLQILDRNAFGNYRQLLYDISRNAAMGNYLDINGNTRTRPNENYARELLQLFAIGTVRLNVDGTQQLDGNGQPMPTYSQTTINNFARVFTGWRFATAPAPGVPNYIDPMVANEPQHDVGSKTLLNGQTLPQSQSTARDLSDAIDNVFNDPNLGPFISRQLIAHLVTSNPSPEYVARVASVFNGSEGTRGDLKQVVRAILLDPEARGDSKPDASYGRLRHPVQLIANVLRAFDALSADRTARSDGYLSPQASSLGMDLFRPPSVFSYFSPSAVAPGTGGLRGPEFAIFTTSTAIRRANFINTMVFSRIAVSTNAPAGTSLDFTPLLSLASSPASLVDALNLQLMHKSMSGAMRDSIITAVNAVSASNRLKRVRTAVYLVLTSSQYQVEK